MKKASIIAGYVMSLLLLSAALKQYVTAWGVPFTATIGTISVAILYLVADILWHALDRE